MSIRFKTYQCTLKDSKFNGKWYGRAISLGTVDTRTLAEEISHSTTVTRSDVAAVLIELFNAMRRHLLNSQTVVLDEIGSFRVAFKSSLADKEKDFTANNIKSYHIVYRPVTTFVANGKVGENGHRRGSYVKTLLDGITAEPLVKPRKTNTTSGTTTPPAEP
mgnify:CR=1 FL=1